MSEWISVDERLPDDGVPVLTEGSQGLILMETHSEDEGWYWCFCEVIGGNMREPDSSDGDDYYAPTHWQPLPAPPSSSGGGKP